MITFANKALERWRDRRKQHVAGWEAVCRLNRLDYCNYAGLMYAFSVSPHFTLSQAERAIADRPHHVGKAFSMLEKLTRKGLVSKLDEKQPLLPRLVKPLHDTARQRGMPSVEKLVSTGNNRLVNHEVYDPGYQRTSLLTYQMYGVDRLASPSQKNTRERLRLALDVWLSYEAQSKWEELREWKSRRWLYFNRNNVPYGEFKYYPDALITMAGKSKAIRVLDGNENCRELRDELDYYFKVKKYDYEVW